jgi:hypothetical protein
VVDLEPNPVATNFYELLGVRLPLKTAACGWSHGAMVPAMCIAWQCGIWMNGTHANFEECSNFPRAMEIRSPRVKDLAFVLRICTCNMDAEYPGPKTSDSTRGIISAQGQIQYHHSVPG